MTPRATANGSAGLPTVAECRHDAVMTYGDYEGHRMWACSDCDRRMYPACLTCVDVGHRNEAHPDDVVLVTRDSLARALAQTAIASRTGPAPDPPLDHPSWTWHVGTADAILAALRAQP